MPPDEKAKQLIESFTSVGTGLSLSVAKQCALITVNEILNNRDTLPRTSSEQTGFYVVMCSIEYWQRVEAGITNFQASAKST